MGEPDGAETAMAIIVKVGAADAADFNLYPHTIRTKWGARHIFVAQIFRSVDDNGFHKIRSGVVGVGASGGHARTAGWLDLSDLYDKSPKSGRTQSAKGGIYEKDCPNGRLHRSIGGGSWPLLSPGKQDVHARLFRWLSHRSVSSH